jgi:hypothetical protein
MFEVKNVAEQGELRVERVNELPTNVKEKEPTNNQHIVGHSETGHHHVVEARAGKFFEDGENPFVCYLQVTAQYAELKHLRSFDTHKSLKLPQGTWKIRRQREWTPEGWQRAQD